jgi:uncharacterized phage protein (TIGR01671 family)
MLLPLRALVVKTFLDGQYTGNAGISDYEDIIEVASVSFDGDKVDYVTDTEGNEYYTNDNTLISLDTSTGLKDWKGKYIFEKDILKVTELFNDRVTEYITDVIWEECAFVLKSGGEDYDTFLSAWASDPYKSTPFFELEVIGNIHKDKYLLK